MKDINLLIWLTQFGISVAAPPVGCILLAVWLRDRFGWGSWVIALGVILGIAGAVEGMRTSIKAMKLFTRGDKDDPPPPVAFNDHD